MIPRQEIVSISKVIDRIEESTSVSSYSRRQILLASASITLLAMAGLAGCSKAGASVAGIELTDIKGEKIRLDDWIGKPFLVNFWASNCKTCMTEMPHLVNFYKQWEESGFTILSIAVPWDKQEFVEGVVQHYQLPFPVVFDKEGRTLELVEEFKGTPTNLLINPDGRVEEVILGMPNFGPIAQQVGGWLGIGLPKEA
jgi:thiol-disulfide isomerase/thioredoxin